MTSKVAIGQDEGKEKTIRPKKGLQLDEKTQLVDETPWKSIYVMALLAYLNAVQFSLYFSSMWPYLQILDRTSTERFYGYIVAIYSFGQILGSPLLGMWSNKSKNVKYPIVVCLGISVIGNILYFSAQTFDQALVRRYMIFVSRTIMGLSAGLVSLLRSYGVMASKSEDRSRTIAWITGGFALGMTTGPALQLLFTPIGYPGWNMFGGLLINMYTAPSFLAIFVNIAGIAAVFFLFEEKYAGITQKVQVNENGELEKVKLPPYDKLAVFICCLTRFTQMFTYTNLETLGSPLAMTIFALTKQQAVTVVAIAHGFLSALAFLIYGSFVVFKLDNVVNFRKCCVAGLVLLTIFHIITYSYPFLPGSLLTYDNTDLYNSTTEPVGCNTDRFDWCKTVKPMNIYVFYIAYSLCIGIAFPSVNLSMNTMYSQIIGPRRQATLQGVQQMFGSIARLTGPLIISNIYQAFGPTISWDIEIVVLLATIAVHIIFRHRLVPLKV